MMASGMTDAEAWTRLVRSAASYDQGNPAANVVALRTTAQLAMRLGRQPNPYEEIERLKARIAELEDMSNATEAAESKEDETPARVRLSPTNGRRRRGSHGRECPA